MKKLKLVTAMFLALVLTVSLMPAALAVEKGTVDPATDVDLGEITVTLKYGETKVSGVEVTLYRVAEGEVRNNNLYFNTAAALGAVELNGLKEDQVRQVTTELAQKINNLQETERTPLKIGPLTTDAEGVAKFGNLPVGVYLVAQSASNSYTFSPVLLYLPYTKDLTVWKFDVATNPKVSYSGGGGGVTPTPDPDPEDPPIIIPDEDPPLANMPDLEDIIDEEPPLAVLPQTGLLQWPIPVMAMAGLLLVALGMVSERKRKAQN